MAGETSQDWGDGVLAPSLGDGAAAVTCKDLTTFSLPLDEQTLREAEEAAKRFVSGPWGSALPDAFGGVQMPTLGEPSDRTVDALAAASLAPAAVPAAATGMGGAAPFGAAAGPAGGWVAVPMEFPWTAAPSGMPPHVVSVGVPLGGAPPSSAPEVAAKACAPSVVAAAPTAAPSQQTPTAAPSQQAPTAAPSQQAPSSTAKSTPAVPPRALWSNMTEEDEDVDAPPAAPPTAAAAAVPAAPPTSGSTATVAAPAIVPSTAAPTTAAPAVAAAAPATAPASPPPVAAPAPATAAPEHAPQQQEGPSAPPSQPVSDQAQEGPSSVAAPPPTVAAPQAPPVVVVTDSTAASTAAGIAAPSLGSKESAASGASGSPSGRGEVTTRPQRTWANIVSKPEKETEAVGSSRSSASAPSASTGKAGEESRTRKDTIIDYLLFLSKHRERAGDSKVNGYHQLELPKELRKFASWIDPGVNNISKAKYIRRGMKNDANNCYVNVVIQSLLPCSALMQLLSHCAPSDPDRPFYTGMVRLCKEFHSRKPEGQGEAFNVLQLPQVKEIISTWQSIGAQQDAGEFLFYMLNGMHEECKWKVLPTEASAPAANGSEGAAGEAAAAPADGDDWAQVGKNNRKVEVRSAGVHEDSPIVRIFGGLIRSSVRSKSAKADSVSVEPFNHLILDISSASVDSVWSALEAYCGAEAVNEGRATKRLQFKLLPKVLILTLKRFSYNKDTGMPQKVKKAVKYEEKLTFDQNWLIDDLFPQEYQLTAVICHIGESANGGHYNAAVRYNSEWYMYDDAIVRPLDPREVLSFQITAYLLLYQCHDKVDIRP